MQYQEKRSLATILGSLLVSAGFTIYLYNKAQDNSIDFENDLHFWGKSILILMGLGIVGMIIVHIILAISHTVITGEKDDISMEDERDKVIELKTSKISQNIFLIGFMFAMIFLAMNKPASFMFITMLSACFLGGFIEEVVKILYYRYGDLFKICSGRR